METRAQSIAQLFLQLHRAGATRAQLAQARDTYLLTMQLYSGLFGGSGNTVLAHEIGTGSLAYHHGGTWDQVLAGMTHGAYLVGDWGEYRLRITASKRARLRAVIGERAEALVFEFFRQRWDAATIPAYCDSINSLDPFTRDLILVRLVEELDRLLDCGAVICFRPPALKAWLRCRRDDLCRLADGLGHHGLAAALTEALDATFAADLPPEIMQIPFPGKGSHYRIVPASYRRRFAPMIYRRAAGYLRRMQRGLAQRVSPAGPATANLADLRRP